MNEETSLIDISTIKDFYRTKILEQTTINYPKITINLIEYFLSNQDKICAIPSIKWEGDVGDSFIVPMNNINLSSFFISAGFKLVPGLSQ